MVATKLRIITGNTPKFKILNIIQIFFIYFNVVMSSNLGRVYSVKITLLITQPTSSTYLLAAMVGNIEWNMLKYKYKTTKSWYQAVNLYKINPNSAIG